MSKRSQDTGTLPTCLTCQHPVDQIVLRRDLATEEVTVSAICHRETWGLRFSRETLKGMGSLAEVFRLGVIEQKWFVPKPCTEAKP